MFPAQVLPCSCTKVTVIAVKSAASKTKAMCTNIPFNTINAGADYQDKKYGNKMRLHNPQVKEGKLNGHTCTVCGSRKAR